jgi:hypothetical protein
MIGLSFLIDRSIGSSSLVGGSNKDGTNDLVMNSFSVIVLGVLTPESSLMFKRTSYVDYS